MAKMSRKEYTKVLIEKRCAFNIKLSYDKEEVTC